jgi:NADH-quinone oxidoreductase subunit G
MAGILAGAEQGEIDFVYLLHADELDTGRLGNAFVVYQGSHGDAGAHRADVILPGAAYTEKDGTWLNVEGRVQLAERAGFPPGEAREDWTILRALSDAIGHRLPYDSLGQLRTAMIAQVPHLARVDQIASAEWGPFGAEGALGDAPFATPIRDFYLTNPITRASRTMAECSALALAAQAEATGTHG